MPHIQVLDDATINKIAAGEVIERPASIVKELVENSIDAGASAITVEIQNGGISLIRVSDNGCGIESGEIRSAFLRHATSKIRTASDLSLITSLGFRGEALASIAAVSRMEVLTKTTEELTGVRYCIEGGHEMFLDEVAAVPGTTFKVENLFFNTPARLKFLKKPATEAAAVTHFMQNIAMGHPEISFAYLRSSTRVLQTPGDYSLKNAVFAVYGKEVLNELLPVHLEGPVTIDGYISRPQSVRANRTYLHFYLNGRMIQSALIEKMLLECYKDLIMPGNYPVAVLHLHADPSIVDVNVHPTKLQVRFSDEQLIKDAVCQAVTEALEAHNLVTHVVSAGQNDQGAQVRTSVETAPMQEERTNPVMQNAMYYADPNLSEKAAYSPSPYDRPAYDRSISERPGQEVREALQTYLPDFPDGKMEQKNEETSTKIPEEESNRKVQKLPPAELIHWVGQVFRTYWLFEYMDTLFLVDQHAAHERVLYDRIRKQMTTGTLDAQILLEPQVVSLSPEDEQTVLTQKALFEQMGFEIEPFGDGTVVIRCVPYIFNGPMSTEDFRKMVSMVTDGAGEARRDILLDKMAMTACKAAVKGNSVLTLQEAKSLYESMLNTENPYNCPHGRPTIVTLTQNQLEKLFKRIV